MKNKKFLALLVAVAVAATMAGCGCGNGNENTGSSGASEYTSELSVENAEEVKESANEEAIKGSIGQSETVSKEDGTAVSNNTSSGENLNSKDGDSKESKTKDTSSKNASYSKNTSKDNNTNKNTSSNKQNNSNSSTTTKPSTGSASNNSSSSNKNNNNNSSGNSNNTSSGNTGNSSAGNTSSGTTTEKPAHTHNWVEVTESYQEWVVDQEAWEEPVYEYKTLCKKCNEVIEYENATELNTHLRACYGYLGNYYTTKVVVDTIYHEEVGHYETVDEVVGYECSCGATK